MCFGLCFNPAASTLFNIKMYLKKKSVAYEFVLQLYLLCARALGRCSCTGTAHCGVGVYFYTIVVSEKTSGADYVNVSVCA